MKSPKRTSAYALMLTAFAVLVVPMNGAAQPQIFNDAATNIYTKEIYGEQCNPESCGSPPGSGPDDVDVELKASTNPLCVYIYIHVSQTVAVYVYPPGIWVKRTITKTIESETCVYSAKNLRLVDYAATPNFMDALSRATFSGATTGIQPSLAQTLLQFDAFDERGQQIGQFTLASL